MHKILDAFSNKKIVPTIYDLGAALQHFKGADYMREIGSLPDHTKNQTIPSLNLVKS